QCGAMAANATSEESIALGKYGEYFGVAYQIKDDLEDMLLENSTLLDMKKGRLTLPLIYLYKKSDEKTREIINKYLGKEDIPPSVAKKIISELNEVGAIKYCVEKIIENSNKAINSLNQIKNSNTKQYLIKMMNLIKNQAIQQFT
ncbi:MAG: polyprenyl synthetase family protein, partial [Candidatus Odinarchaeia archaeon]